MSASKASSEPTDAETVRKAVILARGLGTRMQRPDAQARLDGAQAATADAGHKALIPVGRPFLDYGLAALADAGFTQVCLVVGPGPSPLRDRYDRDQRPTRLTLHFAVQERPLGTADAVSAAEAFAGGEPFAVLNGDNYYPPEALRALRGLTPPGLVAFDRAALIREGGLDPDRVRRYALVRMTERGDLDRIVEKPEIEDLEALGQDARVSMNCWLFTPAIFEACRRVRPSARGELELTDAVALASSELGQRFRTTSFRGVVLDLTSRTDIAAVAARLAPVQVSL
jgi:dTDP-glucose pyrophosphorylase